MQEERNTPEPRTPESDAPKKNTLRTVLMVAVGVVIAALAFYLVFTAISSKRRADAAELRNEELLMDMAQQDLEREYGALNDEFEMFENQRRLITDDSIRRRLNDQYESARIQIERLQQELSDNQRRSAAEIARLRGEIETLRALLRHYVEEIDRLNRENQQLRDENAEIRSQNEQLTSRVNETTRQNEVLSQRMTLAEKLNVSGLMLNALNRKGRHENKLNKVTQLEISFNINENHSTPVGEKVIYARIVSPTGEVLGDGRRFPFENGNVEYTSQITVEFAGEEIGGVKIYYDVNTTLVAGDYTVELFADNFRLISRGFQLR